MCTCVPGLYKIKIAKQRRKLIFFLSRNWSDINSLKIIMFLWIDYLRSQVFFSAWCRVRLPKKKMYRNFFILVYSAVFILVIPDIRYVLPLSITWAAHEIIFTTDLIETATRCRTAAYQAESNASKIYLYINNALFSQFTKSGIKHLNHHYLSLNHYHDTH